MAVRVTYSDPRDAARTVDALLTAADVARDAGNPMLARRYMVLSNELADACERAPVPVIEPGVHYVG